MENTIENNKLIAEFMGLIYNEQRVKQWEDENGWRYEELLYHSSWDWLIPVIDKIYYTDEYISYKSSLSQFSERVWINTKFIEITYETVVDFIKWFNKQNN